MTGDERTESAPMNSEEFEEFLTGLGYCPDGTCGECGACRLRLAGG